MRLRFLLLGIVLVLLLDSCAFKRLLYLQTFELPNEVKEYTRVDSLYKIRTNDLIFLRVSSFDSNINELFNASSNSGGQGQMSGGGGGSGNNHFLTGYMVDDSGYVALPIVGKMKIKDLTIGQASDAIQTKFDGLFKDVNVIVRFVNFKITFMGEVGSPGTKLFQNNELNIYEALTSVGGVTTYGNNKKVLIVRPVNDKFITYRVDLTDRNLLANKDLWLFPNDIVYVEPRKIKSLQISYSDIAFLISTITSTITTILLIKTLSDK